MFTYRLKTVVIMFVAGLVTGIGSLLLFDGCNNRLPKPATITISPKEIKKQAENSNSKLQHEIAVLSDRNIQLTKELRDTKVLLSQAKKQTSQRQATIKKLIAPKGFSAKELLQRVKSIENNDSSYSTCDLLKEEVAELIQENSVKDSLYESQISIQDSIIAGKASAIEAHSRNHAELITLVNQSVEQQESLLNENKQLRKQTRRQKFKSTLKTIGLMVLSGFTAKFLFNH